MRKTSWGILCSPQQLLVSEEKNVWNADLGYYMGGNQILTSTVKLKWHPHTATSELRKQMWGPGLRQEGNKHPAQKERSSLLSRSPWLFKVYGIVRKHSVFQGVSEPSCVLSLSINFRDSTERTRGRVMGENGAPFTLTAEPRYLLSLVSFAT